MSIITKIRPGQFWRQTDKEKSSLFLEYGFGDWTSQLLMHGDLIFIVKAEPVKIKTNQRSMDVTFLHNEKVWTKMFTEADWESYFTLVQDSTEEQKLT